MFGGPFTTLWLREGGIPGPPGGFDMVEVSASLHFDCFVSGAFTRYLPTCWTNGRPSPVSAARSETPARSGLTLT